MRGPSFSSPKMLLYVLLLVSLCSADDPLPLGFANSDVSVFVDAKKHESTEGKADAAFDSLRTSQDAVKRQDDKVDESNFVSPSLDTEGESRGLKDVAYRFGGPPSNELPGDLNGANEGGQPVAFFFDIPRNPAGGIDLPSAPVRFPQPGPDSLARNVQSSAPLVFQRQQPPFGRAAFHRRYRQYIPAGVRQPLAEDYSQNSIPTVPFGPRIVPSLSFSVGSPMGRPLQPFLGAAPNPSAFLNAGVRRPPGMYASVQQQSPRVRYVQRLQQTGSFDPANRDEAMLPYRFAFDSNDGNGTDQYRKETGDASGLVTGSYGYRDSQGVYRFVSYVADKRGFRAAIESNEPGVAPPGSADVTLNTAAPTAYTSTPEGVEQ